MDAREDWSEYWAGKEKELTQTERLGLAYCRLNCWEWDDFIGEKPKDFDKCAYSSKNPIIRFLKGQHSKSYYITPAVRAIEKAIGEAEVSRCWWKFTLGRTDKEWAEWYFSTQHL